MERTDERLQKVVEEYANKHVIISRYQEESLTQLADDMAKDDFGICVYDSCEYLFAAHGYAGYLAHKGNCRFCKERRQKELKELVEQLRNK